MSLLNNHIHFNFFKNKEFNHFYLSIFIMTFWEGMISIFVPIYFFNLWYEIHQIIFFYFLNSFFYIGLTYIWAKIIAKIGEKHAMLASVPFAILYYLWLILVKTHPALFYILPLILATKLVLYNLSYHLNYINHSDRKKRGSELAILWIITLISTAAAPYIWSIIANINFTILFIISSGLIVIGTLPLLKTKEKYEKISFTFKSLFKTMKSSQNKWNIISFSGYATESIIWRTIRPIFIITIIWSLNKTWLIISASMFVSLISFYFIWKLTDKANKIKLLKIGTILYFFAWIGRIFANTAYKVLFIDSYKNLSEKVLHIPRSAHSYDLAKRSDYFEFIVSREIVFNIMRIVIFPILMIIFWIDFHPFLISFLIASIFSLGYVFIKE